MAALLASCASPAPTFDPDALSLYALVTTVDGVYFYPPLGPEPAGLTGTFDPTLAARLEVVLEAEDGAGRASTLGRFTSQTQPGLVLLGAHDLYWMNVPAAAYFTDPALSYRFRALLDGREIGRSDMSSKVFEVLRYVPTLPVGVKLRLEARPAPSIAALAPSRATSGSANLTLTVDGAGFTSDAVVRFGATELTTTKVSDARLTATVPATLLAAPGTPNVTVFVPAPGGGTSPAAVFSVEHVVPTLTFVAPASANAGSGALVLTVGGSAFASGAVVRLDGAALATTFVSSSVLTAVVPAAGLALGRAAMVSVENPAPTSAASGALTFTVLNPAPTVTSLTPASATAGSGAFTLTVDGGSFVPGAVATFDGTALETTFVSSTRLTATVPASSIPTGGTLGVTVANPTPNLGQTASASFTVNNATPSLTTTAPASVTAGSATFTLSVVGSGFVRGAVVSFAGAPLATTFVSSTLLTASVPASAIAVSGLFNVTAENPAPRLGASAALSFTVNAAVPTVGTLNPNATVAGTGLTTTVTGTGFQAGSYVTFAGAALATTYVSSTQLTAVIPGSSVASTGTYAVAVVTPAPGGGTSGALNFTVSPVPPSYTSWDPAHMHDVTIAAGSGNRGLTGADPNGYNYGAVIATLPKTTGKWYFEVTVGAGSADYAWFGVAAALMIPGGGSTGGAGCGCDCRGGSFNTGLWAGPYSGIPTWSSGNRVISVAYDADTGRMWCASNGVWSGNPAAGTGYACNTPIAAHTTVWPFFAVHSGGFTSTANFGQAPFTYAVPTGFNPGWYQ